MVTPNHFDRSKPFYPYVMSYIVAIHGYIELVSRATIEHLRKHRSKPLEEIEKEWAGHPREEVLKRLLNGEPTPLIGKLSLRSSSQKEPIDVDIEEIAEELYKNHKYILEFATSRAAGSLLIAAWESTKSYHDHSHLWEFLHHCRNAAAHNNLFIFLRGQPRHTASWGSLTVTKSLQGKPLFKLLDNNGMLLPGDPIRLLWDIEQAYPAMKA